MPRPPAPLPDDLAVPFSCADARARGVSASRLRSSDLATPYPGVRAPAAPTGPVTAAATDPLAFAADVQAAVTARAHAYALAMHPGVFFAGRMALALWGLPLERLAGEHLAGAALLTATTPLDVAVHAPLRAPRGGGIRSHQVHPRLAFVHERDGLRIATPASTWAMLGAELSVPALVRLGDAIVRVPRDERGRPQPRRQFATPEQLRAAADAPRRRARGRLLAALERVRVGSGSPLETDWRLSAEDAGLPRCELDVEVRDARGRLLGIADAAHRPTRTLVEIEGDHHRVSRAQWVRDIEKHAAYEANGWGVVRLTGAHVRGGGRRAVDILRSTLVRRGYIE